MIACHRRRSRSSLAARIARCSGTVTRHPLLSLIGAAVVLAVSCGGVGDEGPSVAEGDDAPTFTLRSVAGDDVALSDFTSKKPVLLYFSMGPG